MLERDPSSGALLPVDSTSTLLTPSEPVSAVVAPDLAIVVDEPAACPVAESEIVAESAVLAELDNDLRFADLEKASWLPTHPLVTAPERHIGTVFGAYRVLELLGKGGMGYVYRAEHIKLGRPVALKLLRTDSGARKDAITRFFREAKTVNRIRHRNIIDVTDFVELGDGTAFIIMELLQGQSFGKWARSGVDLRRALSVLVQICDGLGAAHAVGVIHRDLKPDNIVVIPTPDGSELVKLLDFGVAKLTQRLDGDASYDTQVGALVGTPAYMSPEQAGGMVIDHRSDIYSLGALMYELFCHQPMFRGRSFGEYVRKHLTEVPTLPRSTPGGAAMPVALEQIIMRCLAKDPNARYENSFRLRDDLLGILASLDTRTYATLALGSQTAKLPLTALVPPAASVVLPQSRTISHRSWWIASALIAIGGGAGAAWFAGSDTTQPGAVVTATSTEPIVTQARTHAETNRQTGSVPQVESSDQSADLVELRFNSTPSGSVFAAGHTAELCRTPCAFNVDLKDSESTNTRTFVVRSNGYHEQPITIDLSKPQRSFYVELAHLPNNKPPIDKPSPAVARIPEQDRRARERISNRPSDHVSLPIAASTNISEASPWEALPLEEQQPSTLEDVVSSPDRANVSAEDPESPTQGIAPSATHNPFQRRR